MNRFQLSSDPVADAGRYYQGVQADQEERNRQFFIWKREFLSDAMSLNLAAPNTILESMADYSLAVPGQKAPHRLCTVGEVIFQALDYPNGPSVDDLIAFLVGKAKAEDEQAVALLDRIATVYADHRAR